MGRGKDRAWLPREASEVCRHGQAQNRRRANRVHPDRFTARSDMDLAVWGTEYRQYLRAVAFTHGLDEEVSVHLIDAATCSPTLLSAAERDGVEL